MSSWPPSRSSNQRAINGGTHFSRGSWGLPASHPGNKSPGHRQFVAGRVSFMSIGLDCQWGLCMTDGDTPFRPPFPWGAIVRDSLFWLKTKKCPSMGVSQHSPLILWPKIRGVEPEVKSGNGITKNSA